LPLLSTVTERAGAWFLRSGIQEPSGGVARYYHSDLASNAAISNEITGYTVSTLAFLHRRTGLPDYRQAALQAADFLTNSAWDPETAIFPFQYPPNGLAYFFDCGIIVRGLLSAWRLSGDEIYFAAALKGGRAMLHDFKGPPIAPIITLPDKKALAFEPRWSAMPGCYQLKAALAWHDLALITGHAEFRQGYEACLLAASKDSEDFLPGSVQQDRVMDRLHPICYFLEGLLPVLDRPECAGAYRQGVEKTARYLHQIEPEFVRSDVYAQLLRARLYAHSLGILAMDEAAGAQEAAETGKFQLTSADSRIDGGFSFGWKQGRDLPYVNPVSTAFCLQALELWADYQTGALAPRLQELI
jgi:hypothetical protein